jgi:hypothetical protein
VGNEGGFSTRWHERIIFLTRAKVEGALTGPLGFPEADWPRTTFSFKLVDNFSSRDDIETIANYELFFRIEKVP